MRKNTEYLAVNKQLQSEIDYRVIGRHMQAIRQKCGMTQAVVAEKMKLGVKYYAALEAGTESISLSRLIQFICLMQSSSDTLLAGCHPDYPYVYVDGIYLQRNWGGEYENVAILVAIAVNEDGYREVLGAAEGMKEDKASWVSFFQWLRGRGLDGVELIVGDKCLGMLEAVGEVFPDAKYQRCTVHFYRNVFSVVPRSKVKLVSKMLKAIHAQESKKAAREKAKAVAARLREMKLKEAAKKVEDSVEETLTYCDFPYEHWTRIRTNNVIERLNREIRRRTRVVGTFLDGNSALMLVCARLRHVAGTQWGNKKYMNMKHLEAACQDASIAD